MCAKWNSDIDREVIIEAIARGASVKKDGEASFTDLHVITRYVPILVTAIHFDSSIPPSLHHHFAMSAVSDAVRAGTLNADSLKRLLSARERAYLKKPSKPYVLLTDIGLRLPTYPLCIKINGTTLTFTERCPQRFDRKPLAGKFSFAVSAKFPENYCWVRVSLSARSPSEAGERALEVLDLLRGIWNLYLTLLHHKWSFPARGPSNGIILGPVHTLHFRNGELASKVYWYDPSYRTPIKPCDLSVKLDKLRAFEKRVRRQLRIANEKEFLIRALIRYVRAQDEYDLDNMFLSLWSLLETLTDTSKLSYDNTIRRAAFICEDRDLAVQELKHLRTWRNKRVHLGESSDDRESHAYSLKSYVDKLLVFLLFNPDARRQSLGEIARFLDLSPDIETLKATIEMQRKALRFLRGR